MKALVTHVTMQSMFMHL